MMTARYIEQEQQEANTSPRQGVRDNFDVLAEEFKNLHPGMSPGASESEFYKAVHQLDPPQSALCLSGGGIRSATFALGILQSLARHGLLFQFNYLSTVSGGGYIGSWLSAWRYHAGDDAILRGLTTRSRETAEEAPELRGLRAYSNYLTPKRGILSADTWTAAALVIRNVLLNWTIFLPLMVAVVLVPLGCAEYISWAKGWKDGFWIWVCLLSAAALYVVGFSQSLLARSADAGRGIDQLWFVGLILFPFYVAGTLLASVGLNPVIRDKVESIGWSVFYGAIAGAAIYCVAWAIAYVRRPQAFLPWREQGTAGDPSPAWLFSCWVLTGAAAGAIIALGYHFWNVHPSDDSLKLLVVGGTVWAMLAVVLADTLYVGLTSHTKNSDAEREWRGRASGWLIAVALVWTVLSGTVLFGPRVLKEGSYWALALAGGTVSGLVSVLAGSNVKSAATEARHLIEKWPLARTASIAALIFLPLLAIMLASGATLAVHAIEQALGLNTDLWRMLVTSAAVLACVLLSLAMSQFVNVNRFSLHAMYRNRLVRGFLGSARSKRDNFDRFTGFDLEDNLPMKKLWPPESGKPCLFPVINMTLNAVATSNLAWQERKAESFVVTPLACGNPTVNFRSTALYGGDREGGISLGTAMTISGAALSPNQGYNSSPLVSFLMMLANLRLGWWLGNPKGDRANRDGPRSFFPFIFEMFGLTTDKGRYVYLSDGGHFENLGIYEMVRRRCRHIVAVDADCDPQCQLQDLGNAVRKVRIDLGVEIRFRGIYVAARVDDPVSEAGGTHIAGTKPEVSGGIYCALADVYYPEHKDPGLLLYIKPGYYGGEPADVRAYARIHKAFPHESTADQWFTESQMESYRVLGSYIIDRICGGGEPILDGSEATDKELTLPNFLCNKADAYIRAYQRSSDLG